MKRDPQDNPIYDPADPNALDPSKSRNTLVDGVTGPSVLPDPAADAPAPAPASEPPAAPTAPTVTGLSNPDAGTNQTAASYTPGQSYSNIAGLTQFDPGVFTDNQGHFFVPGANGQYVYAADNPGAFGIGGKTPTAAFGGGAAPAPAAAASTVAASLPAPTSSPFNAQMRDFMTQQLAKLSEPTTADSPDVQPAIAAFTTQSQRDQQAERDLLAERFYASGGNGNSLNSGGFNTAVQRGAETAAGQRANFTGSTILAASQQKRQQLQAMLQTAVSAGLTDSAQQIQQQIALIDAQLREKGMSLQNDQFGRSLSQQGSQFDRSLNQQDQEFYDALAKQYADLTASMNRDSLLAGLGG